MNAADGCRDYPINIAVCNDGAERLALLLAAGAETALSVYSPCFRPFAMLWVGPRCSALVVEGGYADRPEVEGATAAPYASRWGGKSGLRLMKKAGTRVLD